MNRSALFRFLLLSCLLSYSSVAIGEIPAPLQAAAPGQEADAAQATTEPETPQGIEEGEIPSRAEHLAADLRRIEALIRPSPEIAEIDSALGASDGEIVALRAALDAIDPGQTSLRHLDDLRLPWLRLQGQLQGWRATVDQRFEILQRERERLREVRALWEQTRMEAAAESPDPDLQQRIESTLAEVVDIEERVRGRRNTVGNTAGRLASQQELISDVLQQIDDIAVILRGQLFRRDAPPFWAAFGDPEQQPIVEEARAVTRDWVRALLIYLRLNAALLILSLAWFFLLLLGTLQLRRQAIHQTSRVEDPEQVRRLLGRPYSIALAFAVAAAMFLIRYPGGSASDILLLLVLVPILRLGTVVLPVIPRRLLYGVAALAVLGRLVSAGPDVSLSTRVLLLIVGVVGFLGTGLAAIRGRSQARESGGWLRAAQVLLSIAAVLLGIAVIANILGWVQLAKAFTETTIASLFSAFGWATVVASATVLLPLVIESRLGQVLPSLRRNRASVEEVSIRAITLLALLAWAGGTLVRFNGWAFLRDLYEDIASSELSIGDLTISIDGLIGATIIIAVTWLAARLVKFFMLEEILPRAKLRRGDAQSVVTLVNYGVYGIGLLIAASALGLTGTQLAVVFGALSLGIGFGLQTIVNNFVSGLILIFERPIKVGDVVQTVERFGTVQHIGIRASTIRSFDGAEIVIPNGDLVAKEVINWTRTDQIRRAEVLVGVAYGTDPQVVLEILLRVAEGHPRVREDPEPKAQMISFGNSSLDFRLRCWCNMDDWIDVLSELHVAVNREIEAAGITIPFPQRDLHIIPPKGDGSPDLPPELDTADHPPPPEPEE